MYHIQIDQDHKSCSDLRLLNKFSSRRCLISLDVQKSSLRFNQYMICGLDQFV